MPGTRHAVVPWIAAVAIACGCAPATEPTTEPTTAPAREPAAPPVSSAPDPCRDHGPAQRVAVAEGQTTPLRDGLLVTFEGTMHDHYDDGTSDMILQLVFQGASASGEPLPSALTWMPSAVANPPMHKLPTGDCVRVADIVGGGLVLEVAAPR